MNPRRMLLRIGCLVSALLFFVCSLPISAEEQVPQAPSVEEADAVYFAHLQSGRVLLSEQADKTLPAGSSVKVLSGLLFCEALGDRLKEHVFITSDMLSAASGYRMGLTVDDVLTVEQLLYAAVCGSYNDAFYALACHTSGTLAEFIDDMNTRAEELGAASSNFTDPSGIDDASVTTANDLFRIALAAQKNELYMELCGAVKYQMSATEKMEARTIHNRNAMISSSVTTKYYNKNCLGMNAGWTVKAESCVVALASQKQETYLCIVLGGEDTDEINYGYDIANRLIDWVYDAYTYLEIITPETEISSIGVTVSDLTSSVKVCTQDSLSAYLPAGTEIGKDIIYSVRLMQPSLEAPVEIGTFVGYVAVIYQGEILGTLPLYTAESAARGSFVSSLASMKALLQDRRVWSGLIFFAVALIAWIAIENILRVRRRKKWDKYFSQKLQLPPAPTRKNERRK